MRPYHNRPPARPARPNWQIGFDKSELRFRFFLLDGVVAQLVERLNGIQEVRGSSPLGSTIPVSPLGVNLMALDRTDPCLYIVCI